MGKFDIHPNRLLITGLLFLALMLSVPTMAHAGGIVDSITSSGICKNDGGLIERIIKCLTSTDISNGQPKGAIPRMVKTFLSNPAVTGLIAGLNGAMFVLGATLIGIKISFLPDARVTKKELWILMFKIAGLSWFSANIYSLYEDSVGLINGLMDVIASTVSSSLCSVPPGTTGVFWKVIDCMFDKMTGWGATIGLAGGIFGALLAFLFSGPLGWSVAIGILYFGVKLIFTVARVLHIYVMAFIGLGFIFCVSFLFVPFLFFQETKPYFVKWLNLTVGYIITPILLFAYLGFAMFGLKEIVFCGSKSLFVAYGGAVSDACTGTGTPGAVVLDGGKNLQQNNLFTATVSSNPQEAATGQMAASGQTPFRVSDRTSLGTGSSTVTANTTRMNVDRIASKAGVSTTDWAKKVLAALIASCLLAYILYELLEYIPEMATDLSHGGFMQGAIAGERALGEGMAVATLKLAKDLPTDVAKGFLNGGKAGAALAVAKALNQYRQDVTRKDGRELR